MEQSSPTTFDRVRRRARHVQLVIHHYRRSLSTRLGRCFFLFEFTDFLDRLSTFADPVLLTGDVIINLERAVDPDTVEFVDILSVHGLVQLVAEATHDAGGTLDGCASVCAATYHCRLSNSLTLASAPLDDASLPSATSVHYLRPPMLEVVRSRSFPGGSADVTVICDVGSYIDLD